MIDVRDRVPTHPGRVKLTPVEGQENTFDMVRADDPLEPGTPINRALFQGIADYMGSVQQMIDDKLFEVSQRVRVGDLVDGSIFGLYENGVLVPFIKLLSNYRTAGRILAVRLNCVTSDVLINPGESYYQNCRTDLWLNNDYYSRLDSATQGVLAPISVAVVTNAGYAAISTKIFLLSLQEYNMSSNLGITNEGASLPYFSPVVRRIASLNGTPVNHWTRSIDSYRNNAAYVTPTGSHALGAPGTTVAGIRPALTLPDDFVVTTSVPDTANTMATAEVI